MSLYRYAMQCEAIAEELKSELTGDEYEDVYGAIAAFSVAEWLAWRQEHQNAVSRLAVATPAQRAKLLARVHGTEKLLLVFAACQYCLEAKEILGAVETHCTEGISYRSMIAAAHKVGDAILEQEHSFWPWGGWPSYRDFPPPDYEAMRQKKE